MANVLPKEKKTAVVASLAEGASIRAIERMTGIHRDTIMRLGVRVGTACRDFMDREMRDLDCKTIQVDELWGFVGKKQKQIKDDDNPLEVGDAYIFVAIDAETKLVPAFAVGKRDSYTANLFASDLAGRMANRIQLSSDSFGAYIDAVERSFGPDVDYGQIVKTYAASELAPGRYSPPECVGVRKSALIGSPNMRNISTSFVEKQNHTARMHCRRLSRLTNAFSKKLDNLKAAVALHYAYYNFVKFHSTIRMTPAMKAGVAGSPLTVENLVELAA